MKLPSMDRLMRFNQDLTARADDNFVRILRCVLETNVFPSDVDTRLLLGLLRGKQYRRFYDYVNGLSVSQYSDATSNFVVRQLVTLVKKYPWPVEWFALHAEDNARKAFLHSEHRCMLLNRKFRLYNVLRSPLCNLLQEARSWIQYVLGPLDVGSLLSECDWGPGANVGVGGRATHVGRKFDARPTVTPSAVPYLMLALQLNPQYGLRFCPYRDYPLPPPLRGFNRIYSLDFSRSGFQVVEHNKIAFVPKTADIMRTIAVEPVGNSFLQKGVDNAMRKRLKRVRIDLSDQSPNSRFALYGSEDHQSENGFVTIDIKDASNSISIGLVKELLDPEWFSFLDNIRSPSYLLGGVRNRYEKFVSMGNGFCFPLETLIFASICHASGCGAVGKDFLVYGDDIVVRRKSADVLISNLRTLGFVANTKKTHLNGPFRESCGEDFWAGEPVRAYTLDHRLDSLESIFKFLNLSRRNRRTSLFFRECFWLMFDQIPAELRFVRPFQGPPNTGIDFGDEARSIEAFGRHIPPFGWSRSLQCPRWIELSFETINDRSDFSNEAMVYAALRGNQSDPAKGRAGLPVFTFRQRRRIRVRWTQRSGPTCGWDRRGIPR